MVNVGNSPGSPLLASGPGPNQDHHSSLAATVLGASNLQQAPSVVSPDSASTVSKSGSADEGSFLDAGAFRKVLRKKEFADLPPDEESLG